MYASVVGYDLLMIFGEFRLLCSSTTNVITIPDTFSTHIISFMKAPPGTQQFKIPEFTSTECPISKYEIVTFLSNKGSSQAESIYFDPTGCIIGDLI